MMRAQGGKGITVGGGIGAPERGAAEQHRGPRRIDHPRQRPPGDAQDVGVGPVGTDAEAPQFQHRPVKGGQRRQVVELRGIAGTDALPGRQRQHPAAAHQRPVSGILDQQMGAGRIEGIGIQPGPRAKAQVPQALRRGQVRRPRGNPRDVMTLEQRLHGPTSPLAGTRNTAML
jgi:hypothetical protein